MKRFTELKDKQHEKSAEESSIMHRICSTMKRWVATHPMDFLVADDALTLPCHKIVAQDETHVPLRQALSRFLTMIRDTDYANYEPQMLAMLNYERDVIQQRNALFKYIPHGREGKEDDTTTLILTFDLHKYSSVEIAQQLTLVDSEMFRAIQPSEFAMFLWDRQSEGKMLNLKNFIDRFNKIGFWVSTIICSFEDVRSRTHALEKFIKIARVSRNRF